MANSKDKEPKKTRKWMKLDNAAKIYPSSRTSTGWMSIFRLSVELDEKVDPGILEKALDRTLVRIPTVAQKLKRGLFWYYMEHIEKKAKVVSDARNPCAPMNFRKNDGYMFRVRYYEKRIAVEFFHVLADGTGGMIFLLTLTAEYLELKYGKKIPRGGNILDCNNDPTEDEMGDSFLKYARGVAYTPKERTSFLVKGERANNYSKIITGFLDASEVYAKAKAHGITVTEYLLTHTVMALNEIQKKQYHGKKPKPILICVPINLRKYYPSHTLRNFATIANIGIDPRFGDYTFDEAAKEIHHNMGIVTAEKQVNARISSYVGSEKNVILRGTPLFLKDLALKAAFRYNGNRTSSTTLSNLGVVKLPDEMREHVKRMDFMIGPLLRNPIVCACVTYENTLAFTVVRTIEETDFERNLFTALVKEGLHVKIESNTY
ncbi:MAG: hypothetical protein E7665_08705 [Ruminococcaceae bacterium]|nr:hypothetical protein [Oscillospiraceae bacterium]